MTNFSGENVNAGSGGPKGGGMDSRHNVNEIAEMNAQYLVEVANPVTAEYQQTEAGALPIDWSAKQLKDLFSLKNGYSFKGEFFSNKGPIVLTPGNFKLGGGLYFEARNTKCYEAEYPKGYEFEKGDLVVVMTDLTPDCNLLGKPAFIEIDEKVLHNQRIGKITQLVKSWDRRFLYYTLLSPTYLSTVKNAATGSTVRHTSPSTIAGAWVAEPPVQEQTAIANALSDVDALISELEKLIAKKQAIKTATMQQLLTGRTRLPQFALREDGIKKGYKQSELGEVPEDWEVDSIGRLISITTGAKNTQDRVEDGAYPFFVRSQTIERINSYSFDGEAVLTAGDGVGTGKIFHYINGKFDFHQRVYLMHNFGEELDGYYFYIFFSTNFYDRIMSMTAKSSVDSVRREMISDMKILLPSKAEQTAIATILSDMDSDIQTLEQRLNKTRQIKQGMMQELLTGKTRLVKEVS